MATWVGVSTVLAFMLSSCSTPPEANSATETRAIVVVDDISDPLLVAHRGGPLKNPEASIESFHAAAGSGFPLEMDIKALKDGTLIPLHHWTVDRTMTGATGNPTKLSKEDWAQMRIRAVGGGEEGKPTTWDEIIDTFGGEMLLVPQIDVKGDLLDEFIASIEDRKLVDSVIVQSWSIETTKTVAESGLHALQLVSEKTRLSPRASLLWVPSMWVYQ